MFATAEQKWEQAILHIVQNINNNTPKQVITEKPLWELAHKEEYHIVRNL